MCLEIFEDGFDNPSKVDTFSIHQLVTFLYFLALIHSLDGYQKKKQNKKPFTFFILKEMLFTSFPRVGFQVRGWESSHHSIWSNKRWIERTRSTQAVIRGKWTISKGWSRAEEEEERERSVSTWPLLGHVIRWIKGWEGWWLLRVCATVPTASPSQTWQSGCWAF